MVSLNSSGLDLMERSYNAFNNASNSILESGADPMTVAAASTDLTQAKVGMAVGAYLLKQQNELMETSLQILGIGTNFSGVF